MLAEIDGLEIHVIVNDELDSISPSPNAAVKVASRFMGIPLMLVNSWTERGGATMEMRMDNVCCAMHGISLLLHAEAMSSILALKVISAQEILEDSELKSTILSMLRLHVITDTIPAGRECKALNKGHNWGMKELTLYWQADWSRIESISKSNKSYSTQVVVDVDPDRSASRGAQADQPISLEADPSFAEREAAGATVTPSRHSHISELMHWYPKQLRGGDDKSKSQFFALPNSTAFDYATEGVSHTRSLTFLKKHMNGPFFDLEVIWEEHTYFEFDNRSVEQTMATMVQERYVNHIPTMTGGIGRDELTRFYRDHFIFNNPPDTKNELISRTIGIDRVVDKFIMTFTHDSEVDWLIPGIPPTGRKLEIPFMAVVNIRGDRLYHEHITWYQATVLKQLGLMPEFLPFPYPLTGGKRPAHGRSFEVRAPVAGAETAAKMRHKSSVPSNQLFEGGIREV
ncbi:hypothetical protein CBS147343_10492 [Aspergillus niger]|nr:hypothetical protein CBS133816_9815 [Aspergillus niger]KAI2840424.1 hypothetical protein CBS11350_7000 [Aspergillus niger]KAI2908374.1 hypothetical protein CBS147371_10084 [Aspergillus niger]KAI2952057.1 hypothetical protein CBS147323_10380 [Aspergillus niger]KAI2963908.1 hypothetical protein CBS147324_8799 [Aspergillus niger]